MEESLSSRVYVEIYMVTHVCFTDYSNNSWYFWTQIFYVWFSTELMVNENSQKLGFIYSFEYNILNFSFISSSLLLFPNNTYFVFLYVKWSFMSNQFWSLLSSFCTIFISCWRFSPIHQRLVSSTNTMNYIYTYVSETLHILYHWCIG